MILCVKGLSKGENTIGQSRLKNFLPPFSGRTGSTHSCGTLIVPIGVGATTSSVQVVPEIDMMTPERW